MLTITTKTAYETKKVAEVFFKEVLRRLNKPRACVLGLNGELGAGKTAFAQGIARALGIKEKIQSPTFVLMKTYGIKKSSKTRHPFSRFVHIDCYRMHTYRDAKPLDLKDILQDPHALVVIEWADQIKRVLPTDIITITFEHGEKRNERIISFNDRIGSYI